MFQLAHKTMATWVSPRTPYSKETMNRQASRREQSLNLNDAPVSATEHWSVKARVNKSQSSG